MLEPDGEKNPSSKSHIAIEQLESSQKALMKAVPSVMKQTVKKTMDDAACKVIGASQVIFKARLEKV